MKKNYVVREFNRLMSQIVMSNEYKGFDVLSTVEEFSLVQQEWNRKIIIKSEQEEAGT